ncbi:MAG: hypothetical protein LBM41_03940 [Ruminococcus sp.]|nr:hypothetical protein [Ruminococcus sp.]
MKTINYTEEWSSDRIKELTMSRISHDKNSSKHSNTIRKMSIIAVAAAVIAVSGLGVYAAVTYLTPSEVAEELYYPKLAEQFEIQTSLTEKGSTDTAATAAAVITEPISVTSGDYIFTFLGITSGEDLSREFEEAEDGSTYTVVTIENADGTPFDRETYYANVGMQRFFVTPLIHGVEPWMGGAAIFKDGSATENIIDGKIYRIVSCDNIEIFADTGVSLAISTGGIFDMRAFEYNAETGITTPNPDFDGSSVVFEIPLDPALGNPVKAAEYWAEREAEATATIAESDLPPEHRKFVYMFENADWTDVSVIEGTTKTVSPDENGLYEYSFGEIPGISSGGSLTFSLDYFNLEYNDPMISGGSQITDESGEIVNLYATRYTRNDDDTITFELVKLNNVPEYNP